MLKAIELTRENFRKVAAVVNDPDHQLEVQLNFLKYFEGPDSKVYVVVDSEKEGVNYSTIKGDDFPLMFEVKTQPLEGEAAEFFDVEALH